MALQQSTYSVLRGGGAGSERARRDEIQVKRAEPPLQSGSHKAPSEVRSASSRRWQTARVERRKAYTHDEEEGAPGAARAGEEHGASPF